MKHLRKFNESVDFDPEVLAWTEENLDMIPVDDKQYKMAKAEYDTAMLKDYCEMNLAYLIDEGFFIDVQPHSGAYYNIILRKSSTTNQHGVITPYFKWDDVKNHYIPFILRIQKSYKLASNYINFTSSNNMDLKSELISTLDNTNIYWDLSRITFKIEEYSL
jgi:pantothenate kinase-related protein Tda10